MNAINFNGFIYQDVTEKAKHLFNSGTFDLYELHLEEKTESLIEDEESLNKALENGSTIGVEVGEMEEPAIIFQVYNENGHPASTDANPSALFEHKEEAEAYISYLKNECDLSDVEFEVRDYER